MSWQTRVVDGIHVRWTAVDDVGDADRALLDDVERARERAYVHQGDRDRFVAGAAGARRLLGELLGLDPAEVPIVRDCPDCGGPHGRPWVRDVAIDYSVSHAGGWAVVASTEVVRVGRPRVRVGVDVEPDRVDADDLLAAEVLTADELARPRTDRSFASLWTAKEAAVKATGEGLRRSLRTVEVTAGDTLRWSGPPAPAWSRLHRLAAPDGHVAALVLVPGP